MSAVEHCLAVWIAKQVRLGDVCWLKDESTGTARLWQETESRGVVSVARLPTCRSVFLSLKTCRKCCC